jgi:hypothetical protein
MLTQKFSKENLIPSTNFIILDLSNIIKIEKKIIYNI